MEISDQRIKGVAAVPKRYEALIVRKDGTEFPCLVESESIELFDGRATMLFFQDITGSERAKQVLHHREEQLRFALEGSQCGYFDWDMKTEFVVYSHTYSEILGYSAEEFDPHYRTWEKLLHPEDKASTLKTLQNHLAGKTAFYESEHRLRMKSGDYCWVYALGRVTEHDSEGKPLRMNGMHHAITKRKKLEEELRVVKEGLEAKIAERTLDLQEANVALKVLIKQQHNERSALEGEIFAGIRDVITPIIHNLKRSALDKNQMAAVHLIEENIVGTMSPLSGQPKVRYPGLTSRENEVANLIKNGKVSKEIADLLCISVRTVDLFRYRIRKKLNINNHPVSLTEYLLSFT